jgi:hypothetical protein
MKRYADQWPTVQSVRPAPLVGELPQGEPEPVSVTVPALTSKLRQGLQDNADTLRRVLAPEQLDALARISAARDESFTFPSETWARSVFDFARAYHRAVLPAEQIMAAMVPLYYGRTAGLVLQAREMNPAEFEQQVVQAQADTFMRLKPELVARWRNG